MPLSGDTMTPAMASIDTRTAVNPGALTGVRFLVSKRIEELEAVGESLDRGAPAPAAPGAAVGSGLGRVESRWSALWAGLPSADPREVDAAFRVLAATRADLAAADERHTDLGSQLGGIRGGLEVLRSVYRSLDDLMASSSSAEERSPRRRRASRQVRQ